MRHPFTRGVWMLTLALGFAALAGCGRGTASTRFYVLAPMAVAPRPPGPPPVQSGPAVGIRRVVLPEYLDRPQIVTRAGETKLVLAEFDRWAAPLGDIFTQTLRENLAALIPSEHVAVFPWLPGAPLDYEVTVEVTRFEGTLGGQCVLVASWSIVRRGTRDRPVTGTARFAELSGADYDTLVAAKSRLVVSLSRDIATSLRAVTH